MCDSLQGRAAGRAQQVGCGHSKRRRIEEVFESAVLRVPLRQPLSQWAAAQLPVCSCFPHQRSQAMGAQSGAICDSGRIPQPLSLLYAVGRRHSCSIGGPICLCLLLQRHIRSGVTAVSTCLIAGHLEGSFSSQRASRHGAADDGAVVPWHTVFCAGLSRFFRQADIVYAPTPSLQVLIQFEAQILNSVRCQILVKSSSCIDITQEPIFVARPGGTQEDDGWLLVLVNNGETQRTDLCILETSNISAGKTACS